MASHLENVTEMTITNITTSYQEDHYEDHSKNLVGDMIYLSILLVLGAGGNSLIFCAVAKSSELRRFSNAFICCIALADLIVCAYYVPTMIVHRVTFSNVFGLIGCEINAIILATCMGVSNFSFMFIAVNRYLYILHKTIYRKIFTKTGIVISITLIWLFWITYSIGLLLFQGFDYEDEAYMCMFSDKVSDLGVSAALTFLSVGVPSFTALVCYVAMCMKICIISRTAGGADTKTRFRQESRAVLSVFVAYLIFNICWGPYTLHIYLTKAGFKFPEKEMYWLCVTNSAVNSIIYGIMNSNFRRGYLLVFGIKSNSVRSTAATNATNTN